jgi:beta-mannosidase
VSAWGPEAQGLWRMPVDDGWHVAPCPATGRPPAEGAFVPIAPPGPVQWQAVPGLEGHFGDALYRVAVDLPTAAPSRLRLLCGGAFYSSVWRVNGRELGRQEGYFLPVDLAFEADGPRLALEARISFPREADPGRKRHLTGVFGEWDCLPADLSAGGIWLPVELVADPPLRLAGARLLTRRLWAGGAAGDLKLEAVSDHTAMAGWEARLWYGAQLAWEGQGDWPVPVGRSEIAIPWQVESAHLWQPAERGEPARYRLEVSVASDRGESRLVDDAAIRTVALGPGRRLVVNGHALYVRGMNYGPAAALLGSVTEATVARDLDQALGAGINLLRVHAHVSHPALYRQADARGMLLWQDLPLQWRYAASVAPQARRQGAALVRLLGRHPSVAIYCAHNEPVYVVPPARRTGMRDLKSLASVLVWSSNRARLDPAVAAAMRGADPGGPVFAHSGLLSRTGRSDSHLYFGWYPQFGPPARLDTILRFAPWLVRWVSEFGAQSLPPEETAKAFVPEAPAAADWRRLAERHAAQPELLDRAVGLAGRHRRDLIEASQAYQAWLMGVIIDRLRARKYRPSAAVIGFLWRDAVPAISWSVVDAAGRPKLALAALALQMAPVTCAAILGPDPEAPLGGRVVAINDRQRPIALTVTADLTDPAGGAQRRLGEWTVRLPADSAVDVAAFRLEPTGGAVRLGWQVLEGRRSDGGARWFPLVRPGRPAGVGGSAANLPEDRSSG